MKGRWVLEGAWDFLWMRMGMVGLTFWVIAVGVAGFAQQNKPTVVPVGPVKEQRPVSWRVPQLDQALTLSDFEGMVPRAGLKKQLTEIDDFTQNAPKNGAAPTEKTEVYLGRTATRFYAVFVSHDHQAELIRRHLARRENILKDDTVTLLLDPFADRQRGVLFQLNAEGVQADAAWTEGDDPDYSYDQIWDSEAKVTKDGWMALFSIPFQSLRARQGPAGWGVVLMRRMPRYSEVDEWPAISSNISGTLSQEGMLLGIEGANGGHNLQLNPYALAQNEHTLNMADANAPYFSRRNVEGTAGGDAKLIVKGSVVVDATINPDFSQVESDQPQFTVNQRYAVFFPELRPFFLENANYFSTLIDLVYTRNIVHPEFGGRVTGKVGRTNLGFLAIDDRAPGETEGPGEPLYQKKAFFGVGRVSRDLGKDSSVGVIYTDEELAGSWNRIGGLDFKARLNNKWTLAGQSVVSSTKSLATGGLDGGYTAGPGTKIQVSRNGHSLNFNDTFRDFSQGFQTQVGFLTTTAFPAG